MRAAPRPAYFDPCQTMSIPAAAPASTIRYGSQASMLGGGWRVVRAARVARAVRVARWPAGAASWWTGGGVAAPPGPAFTGLFAMHVPPGFPLGSLPGPGQPPGPPTASDLLASVLRSPSEPADAMKPGSHCAGTHWIRGF